LQSFAFVHGEDQDGAVKDALAGVTKLQVMEAGVQRDPDRSLTDAYPGLLGNHLLGSLDDDVCVVCGPMVMYLAVHPPLSPARSRLS
jgi:hypothetical protein